MARQKRSPFDMSLWPIPAVITAMFLALATPAVAQPLVPPASITDAELAQLLVQGSPWSGPWKVLNPGPAVRFKEGSAVIAFEQKGGRLTGRLVETTCGSCPIGDLRFVTVKNGKLEYMTPTSIDFTLVLSPDGNLEGKDTRGGPQTTKVIMCPSGKTCPKEVEP